MKKSIYIFILLIFSIRFWDLSFISSILSNDDQLLITWIWIILGFIFFKNRQRNKILCSSQYTKYMWLMFLGILISMFSAYAFHNQSFIVTFIAQRNVYSLFVIYLLLFIQPSECDIIKSLKYISICTISVWCLVAINPNLIQLDEEAKEYNLRLMNESAQIGINVKGILFVLIYIYYLIGKYIRKLTLKFFLIASMLIFFLILFQNRSVLFFAIVIYIYSLFKINSKHRGVVFVSLLSLMIVVFIYTSNIWNSLIQETYDQFNNSDYNRWAALKYYIFDYSKNLFCFLFGNGYASLYSDFGKTQQLMKDLGIYLSDIGMFGMWSLFGILPLVVVYKIIVRIIRIKSFPLYLKFICLHIIVVPTIFSFFESQGVLLFSLLIYLYAYYNESRIDNLARTQR